MRERGREREREKEGMSEREGEGEGNMETRETEGETDRERKDHHTLPSLKLIFPSFLTCHTSSPISGNLLVSPLSASS